MRTTARSPYSGHGLALLLAGAVAAAWVVVMALSLRQASLPPETDGLVLVAFPLGTSDTNAFAAVVRAGGDPIRPVFSRPHRNPKDLSDSDNSHDAGSPARPATWRSGPT